MNQQKSIIEKLTESKYEELNERIDDRMNAHRNIYWIMND